VSARTVTDLSRMPVETDLEQLFREHSHMLYRTAYSLLNNAADAEDVLQTIFLRLLRTGLPPELKRNAKGYLYRAAVNLCLDMIRARKRRQDTEDAREVAAPATDHTQTLEEIHRRLVQALSELTPEAAQILVLKYVHCYKDAEIARLLGASRGAIAMRLLRSRLRIKQLIQELGESDETPRA
jgi:RNA polymerase sigma-70 factor, ECF subfamily